VPPAVSIASFAVDAFSYVVSGKSVSDHGLSMVMQEDCSVLKLVAERRSVHLDLILR